MSSCQGSLEAKRWTADPLNGSSNLSLGLNKCLNWGYSVIWHHLGLQLSLKKNVHSDSMMTNWSTET